MSKSPLQPDKQLDVTLHLSRDDRKLGQALSKDEKDAIIHAMIEQFGGVQDHAMGTVVIPIPLEGIDPNVTAQLWIHEWE
jgi:hypothetical protein